MEPTFASIVIKTAVAHSVTYVIAGLLAYTVFNYPRLFAETELRYFMRQTSDPLLRLGPLFQPLRGIIFGIAFFILRKSFFIESDGWLLMWITLVCLSILSTFGPTTASIEGMIFTKLPLR